MTSKKKKKTKREKKYKLKEKYKMLLRNFQERGETEGSATRRRAQRERESERSEGASRALE